MLFSNEKKHFFSEKTDVITFCTKFVTSDQDVNSHNYVVDTLFNVNEDSCIAHIYFNNWIDFFTTNRFAYLQENISAWGPQYFLPYMCKCGTMMSLILYNIISDFLKNSRISQKFLWIYKFLDRVINKF